MRLDKFLKVSRLIKRRTTACEACDASRVLVNGKPAKPAKTLCVGDTITLLFSEGEFSCKVACLDEPKKKDDIASMYEVVNK